MKEPFNGQTYKCPEHGLITGEDVGEDEVDYGVLRHWCLKCHSTVDYVGWRNTPKSKPKRK
jgi:hypothetical protein